MCLRLKNCVATIYRTGKTANRRRGAEAPVFCGFLCVLTYYLWVFNF